MKPSRLVLLLASLLATSAAIGAACSFPEIDFQPASESSSAASGVITGVTTGSSSSTGSAGGSGASGSGSSSSGPLPCVGDGGPCDCDGDGELSWECDGGDCADHDSRAHTMAGFVQTNQPIQEPRRPGTPDFDFDCSGSVEREIPPVPPCNLLGKSGCQGSGYLGPVPACGGPADLAHCNLNLIVCETINDNTAKTQGCR